MTRFQQTGKGLGSDIALTIIVKDESHSKELFTMLWSKIHTFEQRFSRFMTDSELTFVNESAGEETQVSDDFIGLLKQAIRYSKATDGLYNPFVLPALQRVGYKGSWPHVDTHDQSINFSDRVLIPGVEAIKITGNVITIPASSALDFGGIGKGFLLDLLADYLKTQNIKNYCLSLGGDILCDGTDIENAPWKIGIANAQNPEDTIRFYINKSGVRAAVATSGVTKRRGETWHHIIDPRTGVSSRTNVETATVIAKSATEADVFAKCLVISGENGATKIKKRPSIAATLLQIRQGASMKTIPYGDLA